MATDVILLLKVEGDGISDQGVYKLGTTVSQVQQKDGLSAHRRIILEDWVARTVETTDIDVVVGRRGKKGDGSEEKGLCKHG